MFYHLANLNLRWHDLFNKNFFSIKIYNNNNVNLNDKKKTSCTLKGLHLGLFCVTGFNKQIQLWEYKCTFCPIYNNMCMRASPLGVNKTLKYHSTARNGYQGWPLASYFHKLNKHTAAICDTHSHWTRNRSLGASLGTRLKKEGLPNDFSSSHAPLRCLQFKG